MKIEMCKNGKRKKNCNVNFTEFKKCELTKRKLQMKLSVLT